MSYERAAKAVASELEPSVSRQLWAASGCDNYPWPLCAFVLASAKAVGPETAVRLLQRCLPVAADGIPSLKTATAVGKMDLPSLCAAYCAERVLWAIGNRKFDTYGRMWIKDIFILARELWQS